MDAVADLTLDLMFASSNPSHVVNVVHPKPITWRDIFSAINIAAGSNLPFVPIDEWLGKLEALASDLGSQEHLEKVVSREGHFTLFHRTDGDVACAQTARILSRHGCRKQARNA